GHTAGDAPCRPEIENDDLAPHFSEAARDRAAHRSEALAPARRGGADLVEAKDLVVFRQRSEGHREVHLVGAAKDGQMYDPPRRPHRDLLNHVVRSNDRGLVDAQDEVVVVDAPGKGRRAPHHVHYPDAAPLPFSRTELDAQPAVTSGALGEGRWL